MQKLKILLIPDFFNWVLGTIAKQIVNIGTVHDYYFFSQQMLPYYPNEWQQLINTVDFVHILSDFDFEKLVLPSDLPKLGCIHHVTDWQKLKIIPETSDAIAVGSNEWRDFLYSQQVPSESIHVFNYGIDPSEFYPIHNQAEARRQLGINSDTFLIGYSAKYTSNTGGRKGVNVLLDALKILATSDRKFGVLITGPGWDGVVQQLKSYGISEVYYYPFLPDRLMNTCYNALNVYVVTSKVEGGPVPLLNNMACGVTVVTTPVGMAKDYVQDGVNGLVVPKDDAQATAQAIGRLIESPELTSKLANAALETIKNHLTWDKTLAGIEEVYAQIWQAKNSPKKRENKAINLDPALQRQWAMNVDSYLWNLKLCFKGYPTEGLRGIGDAGFTVAIQETPNLLIKGMPLFWHYLQRKKARYQLKKR